MTHYSRDGETASIMALAPVIPVLTVMSVEDGIEQARALVAGGLFAIEVTLRTPSALAAIRAISKSLPDAVAGAGTIVAVEQIDEAIAAGARFLVSPGATLALAKAAAQSPVPFLPGCATASEAMTLRELGFRALKLFPAEAVGGARLLASLVAPLPDLSFCPTGGIDFAKAPDYLKLPNVALCRRIVDAAEGGALGGRLRRSRNAGPRGGGAQARARLREARRERVTDGGSGALALHAALASVSARFLAISRFSAAAPSDNSNSCALMRNSSRPPRCSTERSAAALMRSRTARSSVSEMSVT